MSMTRDLFTGLATTIAGAGIGTYRSDGSAYLPGETAIVFHDTPPSPDRVIMLMIVPLTDEAVLPTGKWLVQCYFRGLPGQPLDTEDLGDAVFNLLQAAGGLILGSVSITQILRNGSVPNGEDPQRRWTRIDRYFVDLDMAATVNRPNGGWD